MRSRWLKPEFFRDKKMAEMGPVTALVYQALWLLADDAGVTQADPEFVHSQLFFRWSAVGVPEVAGALRHLFGLGRIRFFQPGDDLFAEILRFRTHQSIHKPSAFRNLPHLNALDEVVPEWCGTGEALDRHSPPPIHQYTETPRHRDTETPKKSSTAHDVENVKQELPPTSHDALDGHLRASRNPDALIGELRAMHQGLRGVVYPWEVLGRTLEELAVDGGPCTAVRLRAFADRIMRPENVTTPKPGEDAYEAAARRLASEETHAA